MVISTTETNLRFLSDPDIHLFGDGTFQYCPNFSIIGKFVLPLRNCH